MKNNKSTFRISMASNYLAFAVYGHDRNRDLSNIL